MIPGQGWSQPPGSFERVRKALGGFPADTAGTDWNLRDGGGVYTLSDALRAHAFGRSVEHTVQQTVRTASFVNTGIRTFWYGEADFPLVPDVAAPILVTAAGGICDAGDAAGVTNTFVWLTPTQTQSVLASFITIDVNDSGGQHAGRYTAIGGGQYKPVLVPEYSSLPTLVYPRGDQPPTLTVRCCIRGPVEFDPRAAWDTTIWVSAAICADYPGMPVYPAP